MTETDFRLLVQKMRKAQRDYFRTRLRCDLDDARRLEKEVDAEIADEGKGLFGREGKTDATS